jgi:hypothetical protein
VPHEILKPRHDAVFKRLMSDQRLLVSFLQSALDLPPEDYADVQLVDPRLLYDNAEDGFPAGSRDYALVVAWENTGETWAGMDVHGRPAAKMGYTTRRKWIG